MRIDAVAFSTNGCRTAIRLKEAFPEEDIRIYSKTTSDNLGLEAIEGPTKKWTERAFGECDAIVYIGAVGIAVRYIAPFIKSKDTDPAVVCMDEHGHYAIALLSGHIGGCNQLTERISERLGCEPVITTATDINGRFSVDTFATVNGMRIMSLAIAKDVSARVLDGRFVGFRSDLPIEGKFPVGIVSAEEGEFGVSVSTDPAKRPFDTTLRLIPMDISLGIGCKRGTDPAKLDAFVRRILEEDGIAKERVSCVSSVDLKKDEEAVLALARSLRTPARFFTSEQLNSVEGDFSKSDFVRSVTSVDCVCERSAVISNGGELIRRKTAEDGMTIAIAKHTISPRFLRWRASSSSRGPPRAGPSHTFWPRGAWTFTSGSPPSTARRSWSPTTT